MKKRSAEAWASVIAGLEGDRATVAEQEAAAAAEARPLALPASTGDRTAAAQLMQINDRRAALARQAETLDVALADARDRLAAAQQAEADIQTAARRAALREASGEMVNRAAAVDAAARVLAQAMGDYDQHLLAMSRMGLDATHHRRLSNRTMIAGGLHLAGLTGKVPLASCSPHHRKTLRDWSAQMLGDLVEAPARPAEAPREPAVAEAAA